MLQQARAPSAGWAGGTNGTRLAPRKKNSPATTTSTQTETLTTTSALVTQADSRMPATATTVRTAMISIAPTLTVASSPKYSGGSPSRLET